MIKEVLFSENPPKLEYKPIKKPIVFIGCNIKTEYDENRIKIKDALNPKRILHCERNLYGLCLEPDNKHASFVRYLSHFKSIDLFGYSKILNEYSLSSEENFGYLEHGLYPVDSKYINEYIPNFTYNHLFNDDVEMPMHQRIKSVNMFFLLPN
jgi:hypothetical protein